MVQLGPGTGDRGLGTGPSERFHAAGGAAWDALVTAQGTHPSLAPPTHPPGSLPICYKHQP